MRPYFIPVPGYIMPEKRHDVKGDASRAIFQHVPFSSLTDAVRVHSYAFYFPDR
jgi:hypothetical protein